MWRPNEGVQVRVRIDREFVACFACAGLSLTKKVERPSRLLCAACRVLKGVMGSK